MTTNIGEVGAPLWLVRLGECEYRRIAFAAQVGDGGFGGTS
jgi:hypothetical protein